MPMSNCQTIPGTWPCYFDSDKDTSFKTFPSNWGWFHRDTVCEKHWRWKKVYVCLFTCAVTRAVHLKVATDLSTYIIIVLYYVLNTVQLYARISICYFITCTKVKVHKYRHGHAINVKAKLQNLWWIWLYKILL